MKSSKTVFILITLLVTLRPLSLAIPGIGLSLIDELIVLIWGLFIILNIIKLKLSKSVLFFLGLFLLIIIESYFSYYYTSLLNTIIQTVIHLKFLTFLTLLYFYLNDYHFHKLMKYLMYFSILGLILNILFGVYFFELFNIEYRERFGLFRYVGFQINPNIASIASATFIFYLSYFGNKIEKYIFIPLLLILLFLTGSHTGLLLLFILLIIYILDKQYKPIYILTLFTIFPIIMFGLIFLSGLTDKLNQTSERFDAGNNSEYARTVILYNGFRIAQDHFPIGAGSGNYATPISRNSKVYYDYQMDKVTVIKWFLEGRDRNTGIHDTTFGILLGELGFLGTIVYFLFHFIFIGRMYRKKNKKNIIIILMWIIIIFIAATKPLFIQWDFLLYIILILLIPIKNKNRYFRK